MRTDSQLLEILLDIYKESIRYYNEVGDTQESHFAGICATLWNTCESIIDEDEKHRILPIIEGNKPFPNIIEYIWDSDYRFDRSRGYYWKAFQCEPRVKYLEKLIEKHRLREIKNGTYESI